MGLDMYLSKINKKVVYIEEFRECIRIMDEQMAKKRLLGIIEDYSTLSLPEFLEKNHLRGLLNKYNESATDKVLREQIKAEIVEFIEDTKKEIKEIPEVDTHVVSTELCYWGKHSDLNGILEQMYFDRGGEDTFNCEYLLLSKEDVIDLIGLHKEHLNGEIEIPNFSGFFWGQTILDDWKNSLKDFEKVLAETDWDNETVYYSCWW